MILGASLAVPLLAGEETTIDDALSLSKQSGRPVLAVAGSKT